MGPVGPQGLPGPQGPQGVPGPASGWNFRGPFNPNASYAVNDVVSYNGSTYIATAPNAASAGSSDPAPDQNAAAWASLTGSNSQWDCPGVQFAPPCSGLGCLFGTVGASFNSPDDVGSIIYNDGVQADYTRTVTGTLPAQGFSEHWYMVHYLTGSVGTETLYGPAFVLYDAGGFNNSMDYVADVFDQYGQPMQECNVAAPFQTAPAQGVTQWSGNSGGFDYNSYTYPSQCGPASTPIYIRVRPVSQNYQCNSYKLVLYNG